MYIIGDTLYAPKIVDPKECEVQYYDLFKL